MSESPVYPWYQVVRGNDLAQGGLLLGCPRFIIPQDANHTEASLTLKCETVDAIVLTQSCDLAIRPDGNCEATDVLMCVFYLKKNLQEHPVFRKWEAW